MSTIHYKFSSAKDFSNVTFDSVSISLKNLKELITASTNAGAAQDNDLKIYNAQTNEEYKGDNTMIMKNTSVVVKRVPMVGGRRFTKPVMFNSAAGGFGPSHNVVSGTSNVGNSSTTASQHPPPLVPPARFSHGIRPQLGGFYNTPSNHSTTKTSIGIAASSITGTLGVRHGEEVNSEAHKIALMMSSTGSEYTQSQENFQNNKHAYFYEQTGTPPTGYICHRCGKSGHFIKQCPTNQDYTVEVRKLSRPTGIPKVFLRTIDHYQPGAVLQNDGTFAISLVDEAAELDKNDNPHTADNPLNGVPSVKKVKMDIEPSSSVDTLTVKKLALPPVLMQPPRPSELVVPIEVAVFPAAPQIPSKYVCSIDNRIFVDPEKTMCCGETFCKTCIRTHLKTHQFTCFNCKARIPYSQLSKNTALQGEIEAYNNDTNCINKS